MAARALAAQVRGDGPARALATRFLRRADPGALRRALAVDPRRFRLLARVRRARGADPRTVRAVGQLAAYPDAEVTALLRQLTRDLSPALAAAAREALAAQQAAGGAGP